MRLPARWFFALLLMVVLSANALAATILCEKSFLGEEVGWYHDAAKYYLEDNVIDPKQASIYVARTPSNELYAHSNFTTSKDSNPVKLLTTDSNNLLDITMNMIDRGQLLELTDYEKINFIFDSSLFSQRGELLIDTPVAFSNVKVSSGYGSELKLASIVASEGKTIWGIKGANDFHINPGTNFTKTLDLLHSIKSHNNTKLLSLVIDTATSERIANTGLSKIKIPFDPTKPRSNNDLKKVLDKCRNQVLVIMGHVEGKSFVVRSPYGRIVNRYDFSVIDKIAKQNENTVIYLGCNTAFETGVGTTTTINSIDTVKGIARAVDGQNLYEFLAMYATSDNPVYVSQLEAGSKQIITPKKYSKVKTATSKKVSYFRIVGQVGATGMLMVTAPSQTQDAKNSRPIIINQGDYGFNIFRPGIAGLIDMGADDVYVRSIEDAGPAKKAGLELGDKIIKINGISIKNIKRPKLENLLVGTNRLVVVVIKKDGKKSQHSIYPNVRKVAKPKLPEEVRREING